MESRVGLEYIVENAEYMGKLAAALGSPSIPVKRQVVELLSALCVYSAAGYGRALDTLAHYQSLKGERYRFSVIVSELEKTTQLDYQTALMAFVNCLIISAPHLDDRIRIRNEFIGLNILPILNKLRQSCGSESAASVGADLGVQLDVFSEQRDSDDARGPAPGGLNLNSHLDVFCAVLRRVADTPQEGAFLGLLQHLLRAEPSEPLGALAFSAAETLVHRATLIESEEDAARLLRTLPANQGKLGCINCQQQRGDSTSPGRKSSLQAGRALSPPPPPPPSNAPLPPPPPPPCFGPPPPPPPAPGVLPPPPPSRGVSAPSSAADSQADQLRLLPQQETPVPKTKMKTVNWNKIPNNKVIGKNNIWSIVASNHKHGSSGSLDWEEMEGLFCQQAPPGSAGSSPRLGRSHLMESADKRPRKETTEIILLDGKRSLNVNIFLKQFRSTNEEIMEMLRSGTEGAVGSERLRGLLRLLPELDELDVLKAFNGDNTKLGNAEKFLMMLIQLPNYKLRIEAMLLKEEFGTNTSYLESSINAILVAGDDLMSSQALQEVLYIALMAGNFLNAGGYAGCAAGVKLSSLQKLTDIRANKPGMNLMHYVATQAEKKNKDLVHFADDVRMLEDASKTTAEQINNEINALEARITKLKNQIESPSTDDDIKSQMDEFLSMATKEVSALKKDMEEVETMRVSLADFFCEDPASFKLDECFKVLLSFCVRFRQAAGENTRRRLQEQQAVARRTQREDQIRRRQGSNAGTPCSDSEGGLVDSLLLDIRAGFPQGRRPSRRLDPENLPSVTIDASPDITPTGSLRRRRGRLPSEEDEGGLLRFLRTSSDSQRERKSWGSLDRSWARQGGPVRARLEITGSARERPPSPRNVPQPVPQPTEAPQEEGPKPKEWRQKIESWLRANHQDQQTDELRSRSRRLQVNRRSFEDSESERSGPLDTLPEGKMPENQEENETIQKQKNVRERRDWKPSAVLDKDVVSAMEAIEDIQPENGNIQSQQKAEESAEDMRRIRRQRSRQAIETPDVAPLGSILEEDKSKLTPLARRSTALDKSTPNKIEIDSDNIETPPVTRRAFVPPSEIREPCKRFQPSLTVTGRVEVEKETQNVRASEILGDGHFDRHSAARRTRRFRRPADHNSQSDDSPGAGTEDMESKETVAETRTTRPTILDLSVSRPVTGVSKSEPADVDDRDGRLKRWQRRLPGREGGDTVECDQSGLPAIKAGDRARHRTSINREDVQKAIRELKSPPEGSARHTNFVGVRTATSLEQNPERRPENELKDEGFEETQSLNSESASQGASSGCNEPAINKISTRSSGGRTAGAASPRLPVRDSKAPDRRALGLRKADSQSSVGSLRSRGSLRSSRSSLNSSASVATVRRGPPPPRPRATPLAQRPPVAASRSSSSGSSVAHRVPRPAVPALVRADSGGSSVSPRPPSGFMRPTQASRTKVQRSNSRPSAAVK